MMKVKDALYNGETYPLDIAEACHAYNRETGLHGIQHWAYPRHNDALIIKHYEGVEMVSRQGLVDKLVTLRGLRLVEVAV